MPAARKVAGISDSAVAKATGRTWAEWIKALNAAGAKKLDHPAIAEVLTTKFGVGPWWSQMVTVGYEQAVLGRAKHAKGKTFEVGISKTINAPVGEAFNAWTKPTARRRWLPDADLKIRKATRDKSARITWDAAAGDKASSVSVNFWPKGAAKCMVQVGHGKLPSAAACTRVKKYWTARLAALKAMLEG
jgi:hypothetical protein